MHSRYEICERPAFKNTRAFCFGVGQDGHQFAVGIQICFAWRLPGVPNRGPGPDTPSTTTGPPNWHEL